MPFLLPKSLKGLMPLLLLILAVLLLVFQYTTLSKFGVLSPNRTYFSPADFLTAVQNTVAFDWLDIALASLILTGILAVLTCEVWKKGLTTFLAAVFTSEKQTLALLCTSSLIAVRFYLAPGELSWGGDAAEHLTYASLMTQALGSGEFPIWTNSFGTGTPYLQFYGFLFFYAAGLVDLLCRDLLLSLKILLAASHLVSGVGMYLLGRWLCRSRRAGFLAGLAYVLCLWHTQHVLFMGRLPLSLFYALLPWPFYCFERLRSAPAQRVPLALSGGISLGALFLVHPGYGLWAAILLVLYLSLRLWEHRQDPSFRKLLASSIALMAGGAACGAYLVLPMWLDREYTGLFAGFSLENIQGPTWRHVLAWSNFRFWLLPLPSADQHWYGGYLGLSLVGLSIIGVWGLFRGGFRRKRPGPALAGSCCLAFCTVLAFGYHWPLIRSLPGLHLLASYRYLLFASFFLALMTGVGARTLLLARPKAKLRVPLYTLLLLAIALDLGPTTFQHPYRAVDPGNDPTGYPLSWFASFREEAAPYRDRGELPPYRIFWAMGKLNPFLTISRLWFDTGTPTPQALYNGDLRPVSELVNPLERYLSLVLAGAPEPDGQLAPARTFDLILGALGLLNVKYLLSTQSEDEVKVLSLPLHTPVLVSPRISGLPLGEPTEARALMRNVHSDSQREAVEKILPVFWVVERMEIDLEKRTCARLLVLGHEGEEDLGTSPEVEVLSHQVWNQRVEMQVAVSAPCFARLAYAYFPYLQVQIDGQEVTPLQTVDRFIALRLEAGTHRIVLEPRLSPLRRLLLLLDLGLLVAAIWAWVGTYRPSTGR